jgi:hypothetical protein
VLPLPPGRKPEQGHGHVGTIAVDSEQGAFTEFTIRLPHCWRRYGRKKKISVTAPAAYTSTR